MEWTWTSNKVNCEMNAASSKLGDLPRPPLLRQQSKIKLSVKKWKLKKRQAVPLLNGVNDLVLVLECLLHGSSDLPHLSVKVDVALLLSR